MSEKLKAQLRDRSLRATAPRLALMECLQQYKGAMPYGQLQKSLSGFDRVTLYRTLQTLLQQGIIHVASTLSGENYYALCPKQCTEGAHQHRHIHFNCNNCQQVYCIPIEQEMAFKLPGYKVDKIDFQVSGVCENCMEQSK